MKTQQESSPLIWILAIVVAGVVISQADPRLLELGSILILGPAALVVALAAIVATSAAIIAGPIVGALLIWWTVRTTNRRDDPRCQNVPLNDP